MLEHNSVLLLEKLQLILDCLLNGRFISYSFDFELLELSKYSYGNRRPDKVIRTGSNEFSCDDESL